MIFFNFHHHNSAAGNGIYNADSSHEAPSQAFSIGLHPQDLHDDWTEDLNKIKKISLNKNCLAIGECGLDGLIAAPQLLQEEVFAAHLHWADEIGKPVIIHCVRKFQETVSLCKGLNQAAVIHGFNKKKELAGELLSHGFYLSFGAALLHSVSLQETFKTIPRERLFLETDDKEVDISEIYTTAGNLLNIPLEELAGQVSENLKRICNEH